MDFPNPMYDAKNAKRVPGSEVFYDCFYISDDIMTIMPKQRAISDGTALCLLFGEGRFMPNHREAMVNPVLRSGPFHPSVLI